MAHGVPAPATPDAPLPAGLRLRAIHGDQGWRIGGSGLPDRTGRDRPRARGADRVAASRLEAKGVGAAGARDGRGHQRGQDQLPGRCRPGATTWSWLAGRPGPS